jgi:alpha-tubulin suppressor-like RCC1 family protein
MKRFVLFRMAAVGAVAWLGSSCSDSEPTPLELNGPPASASILAGDGQTGPSGARLAQALTVLVRDEAGRAVPAVEVSWTATGGVLSVSTDSTDDDGRSSVTWTMPGTPGDYLARATVAGLPVVTFRGKASPGLPVALALISGDNQKEIIGTVLQPLVVAVRDQEGKPVPGVAVTWKASGGQLAAAVDSSGADGLASIAWTLPQAPGTYSVEASAPGVGTVLFSAYAAPRLVFRYLDAGSYHSCGITTTEELYCWGYNGDGQAGDSVGGFKSYPSRVERPDRFRAVSGGRYHTCAVTLSGEVVCWGAARDGRTSGGGIATYQYVQAGEVHSCGITLTKQVWCWGYNREGETGRGLLSDQESPDSTLLPAGWLSPLPPLFRSVSVGAMFTCAIEVRDNEVEGRAYCWGYGRQGQLGIGTPPFAGPFPDRTPVPTLVGGGFRADPFVVVPPPPDPAFPLPTGPFIAAGFAHACGVATTGLLCWGLNENGQLGTGGTGGVFSPVPVPTPAPLVRITAGNRHTCGQTSQGAVYCWGDNTYGQLGDGSNTSRLVPTLVPGTGGGGLVFAYIKAGELSTCGLTSTGVAYCWGDNEYGQLGTGTQVSANTPKKVAFQP